MKLIKILCTLALSSVMLTSHATTREDADSLLKAALAEIKGKGLDAAKASITAGGAFTKDDGKLYVFVSDFQGNVLAHAVNGKLVGKNLWEAKDASGKLMVQEQAELAKTKGGGLVSIRWMNPATKQIGDAEVIVARVPGQDCYIGVPRFK